ncbi:alpha/beta fold hydrolase [Sphaerisporangium fuscum]|uniref:alpha/beta fold hydrolase n=1 Tax=Sphaerisporangium fuscum TaxID=2835868 RepID=UPI001BDD7F2B|nr:alpha/beta fold hydrolase [Sphaerisporangium fuscum]
MKLNVHEHGDGDRLALLIHGGMWDHRTWHAVERELATAGYRVLAPDLRGHGLSPRGPCRPELVAGDLVDSLPTGADLAIGHSFGGLALSLAVERLRPRRAVYSDPGFSPRNVTPQALAFMRQLLAGATAESLRRINSRWTDADIEAELAGLALVDPAFLDEAAALDADYLPERPCVPSLVQLADPSLALTDAEVALLRERGFETRTVKGAGHCIHLDDLPGFLASLDGWI